MGAKDFGSIEADYDFFMAHATEAEQDAAEYARELAGFAEGRLATRLLDFGCGAGAFTERLLETLGWPPESLDLALVEPVRRQRKVAQQRLAKFTRRAIAGGESLPLAGPAPFDLVLSNHALYYVDDLEETLRQMRAALAPEGRLLLAIAGWDNVLLDFWKRGFEILGRPVPYYTAEDVAAGLSRLGMRVHKTKSSYRLRFPDTVENRLKILRFLLGEHLPAIGPERLLGEFDRHLRAGHVDISTQSDHFAATMR